MQGTLVLRLPAPWVFTESFFLPQHERGIHFIYGTLLSMLLMARRDPFGSPHHGWSAAQHWVSLGLVSLRGGAGAAVNDGLVSSDSEAPRSSRPLGSPGRGRTEATGPQRAFQGGLRVRMGCPQLPL